MMAAEPKISGTKNKLMKAQKTPTLKNNDTLRFWGIEYEDGYADCNDSGMELILDI